MGPESKKLPVESRELVRDLEVLSQNKRNIIDTVKHLGSMKKWVLASA